MPALKRNWYASTPRSRRTGSTPHSTSSNRCCINIRTFRLGHLIKGDLLLARVRGRSPPSANAANGSAGIVSPTCARRPSCPAQRLQRQNHLLNNAAALPAADAAGPEITRSSWIPKSRGSISTRTTGGRPRFVADYYISHGKLGADKMREGDKKTPVGVYHVTTSLPRQKLTDLYGSGAFPINYPNEWDKRQGRNGHGIWLARHAVRHLLAPAEGLRRLRRARQPGPRCIVEEPAGRADAGDHQQQHRMAVARRLAERAQRAAEDDRRMARCDWESRDVPIATRSHYSKKFKADGQGLTGQWIEQKRKVNAGKSWIKVATGNISMFRNPGKDEHVVVTFEQDYRSNNLSNQMKKRQYWIKRGRSPGRSPYEGAA
jgi:hypothetical protein